MKPNTIHYHMKLDIIDKKLLEKLKERQKQHYVREEQLKEQRINDETATLRYKAPTF